MKTVPYPSKADLSYESGVFGRCNHVGWMLS